MFAILKIIGYVYMCVDGFLEYGIIPRQDNYYDGRTQQNMDSLPRSQSDSCPDVLLLLLIVYIETSQTQGRLTYKWLLMSKVKAFVLPDLRPVREHRLTRHCLFSGFLLNGR
jgi:hypothetical protein